MKVRVLRPILFDGVDYKPGVYEFPDEMKSHWYFLACKNNGIFMILEEPKAVPVESPKAETYHEHRAEWESKAEKKAEEQPKPKKKRRSKKKVIPKED